MSLDLASRLFDWSSIALAIGACIVFVATAAIVWLGIVKEHHWELLREHANEKIAAVGLETAKANAELGTAQADIAKAQATAATANLEAARLKFELDREVQKRAPRVLSDENARAFVAAIRGKIPAVTMFIEVGWEPRRFAEQIEIALSQAGVTIHERQPSPNREWPKEVAARMVPFPPSNGALMYAPGFTGNGADLTSDPLFAALTAAGIFGGGFNGPKLLDEFNPNEHAIYIGEKAPW